MRLDSELKQQLDAAKGTGNDVEAVLLLDQSLPMFEKADPVAVKAFAEDVVKRVETDSGVKPGVVNVLSNLGAVVVSAAEPFVRRLLEQPEFESATANAGEAEAAGKS